MKLSTRRLIMRRPSPMRSRARSRRPPSRFGPDADPRGYRKPSENMPALANRRSRRTSGRFWISRSRASATGEPRSAALQTACRMRLLDLVLGAGPADANAQRRATAGFNGRGVPPDSATAAPPFDDPDPSPPAKSKPRHAAYNSLDGDIRSSVVQRYNPSRRQTPRVRSDLSNWTITHESRKFGGNLWRESFGLARPPHCWNDRGSPSRLRLKETRDLGNPLPSDRADPLPAKSWIGPHGI